MTLSVFDEGVAVFNQGEIGNEWFIILTGQVNVLLSKTGNPADAFQIATLNTGAGFGELALVNDKARSASVITNAKTELLCIDKWDYNRFVVTGNGSRLSLNSSQSAEKVDRLNEIFVQPFVRTFIRLNESKFGRNVTRIIGKMATKIIFWSFLSLLNITVILLIFFLSSSKLSSL
jgi:CRP-like cAMP-binding protein